MIQSLDPYFREILCLYKEYRNALSDDNIDEIYDRISFVNFMGIVIVYFYREKYDINIFPKVLDYVFQNIDNLDEFVELHNYGSKDGSLEDAHSFEDIFVRKIIDGSTKDIPIIR